MSSRQVSDASSSQSSTAMNIRKFIKDTELSDNLNKSSSTAQTTAQEIEPAGNNSEQNKGPADSSFLFTTQNAKLNPITEESMSKSGNELNQNILQQPSGSDLRNGTYQNKLKYLPNHDFQLDNSGSYISNKCSPPSSIANTFQYKSHPNAKTKSSLGNPSKGSIAESNEDQVKHVTFPVITSTMNNSSAFNTTPDWMPAELGDKWVPRSSIELDTQGNLGLPDLGSSVRITRPHSNDQLDEINLNLQLSSSNTMIHNSKRETNETPMWKKATKEYELHKKSKPHLQNIFMTFESQEDKADKSDEKEINQNHSISSTLSTPMASIANLGFSNQLNKEQITRLENILVDEVKDKSKNDQFHLQKPDSPLKLFGDKYNTFTKEKLTGILAKINHKPPEIATPIAQVNKKVGNAEEEIRQTHEPKLKIKNFTKSRSYTEEQFLQNANNIFNNIQRRGFKMKNNNRLRSSSNSHTTATSTPKNDKKVDNIDIVSTHDDYSSFTTGFDEEDSLNNYHQYNTDDALDNESNNNEYTSFDHSSKNNETSRNHIHHEPRNPHDLPSQLSDYDGSYTFDEISDEDDVSDVEQGSDGSNSLSNKQNNKGQYQQKEGHQLPRPTNYSSDKYSAIEEMNLRVDQLEKMMKEFNATIHKEDLKNLMLENARLRDELDYQKNLFSSELHIDNADITNEDYSQMRDFIKWKRASQLKLQQTSPKPPLSLLKEKNVDNQSIVRGRVKPGTQLPVVYDNMVFDDENKKWVVPDNKENQRGSLDSIDSLVTRSIEHESENDPAIKYEDDIERYPYRSNIKFKNDNVKKRSNSKLEVSFHLPHSDAEVEKDKSSLNNNVTQISQLDDITFSQTRKKLVSVITDILSGEENFEEISWNDITEITLSECLLDNIKDLNKFLPNLVNVDLSHNEIKFLDGLPKTILGLNLSHNMIENITSFNQYHDLQHLNVSYNHLVNLSNFNHNIHLTELGVSKNKLVSINGINKLSNLTKLDASQNNLMGEINFKNFHLLNLQEVNFAENNIQSIIGLESLPNLRVLNVNENQLISISCTNKHFHLKKLLLKFNNLKKLNLEPYPFLRVLRIDGNSLNIVTDFKKLKFLDEVSCKSQHNIKVIENVFDGSNDAQVLDLSGNSQFNLLGYSNKFAKQIQTNSFLNVNHLILSAMNLTKIPNSFANLFPNVRELNLNFNRLNDIGGLSGLRNIKKLYLVSNNISKTEVIITGLIGARSTLKVLDLRLNPCNIELYPYVFNPQELDYTKLQNIDNISPIELENLDDIESFAIHYQSLNKNVEEWIERDSKFYDKLSNEPNTSKARQRLNYETLLINFFVHLKRLDGGLITKEKKHIFKRRLNSNELCDLK